MIFIGTCAGISIALLALGPGLAPLLGEKVRRKRIAQCGELWREENPDDDETGDAATDGRTSPSPE
ncbi:MAG TPA: hypothetical protein EYN79_09805 [Planctomycetes bacterium]|nr:hypothetical protein [Planctomycetota bacterium]HIN80704.1 hypothetical protein [Planctomycetota bacterium]